MAIKPISLLRHAATVIRDAVNPSENTANRVGTAILDTVDTLAAYMPKFAPYIGSDGNWYVFDVDTEEYVNSGISSQGPKGDPGGMINISGPFPWNGISLQTTATDIPFKADAGVMDSDYIMVVGNVVVSGTPKKLFAFSNVIPIWRSYVAGEYLSVFSVAAQSINVYVTGAAVNPDGSTTSIRMIKDNSSATVAVYITDVYLMPKS